MNRMRFLASGVAAAAALAATTLSVAVADPAGSGTSQDPPAPSMLETESNSFEKFVSQTDQFAERSGFGKVVADYQAHAVIVYWKGEPPAELLKLDATQFDATLEVRPAAFSFAELNAAGLKLLHDKTLDLDVTGTMPDATYSGLEVTVAEMPQNTRDGDTSRARSMLASATDVPITGISIDGGVGEWTRQNDSAPWQGGGGMTSRAGSCTVGFAVLKGSAGRLLSAGHCDPGGEANMRDANGDTLSNGGADIQVKHTNDTMLMDPVNGTIGEVYGGPWNAGTGHSRYEFKVVAKSLPTEGTPVCTSGANTGEHCNVVIHNTGVNRDCGPGLAYTCHGFVVRNTAGGVVGGPGDSGAPVYYNRGDGTVGARGILIGPPLNASGVPTYQVPCPTNIWFPGTVGCGSRGFVIGYHTLENAWGVTIEFE